VAETSGAANGPEALGQQIAQTLKGQGAEDILTACRAMDAG